MPNNHRIIVRRGARSAGGGMPNSTGSDQLRDNVNCAAVNRACHAFLMERDPAYAAEQRGFREQLNRRNARQNGTLKD